LGKAKGVIFLEIGIPREDKERESRVSIVPGDVRKLVEAGHAVFVERGAGLAAGFPDKEYKGAGAGITGSAWKHKMVVKVKVQASDPIKENQVLMAYLHVEKGQSPGLLKKLLKKKATSYAFEEIRNRNGKRIVNLGYEGGVVGMYEGLRLLGRILGGTGQANPFSSLSEIRGIGKEKAYRLLSGLDLKMEINVAIMGAGNVSRGAQEVLGKTGIKPQVLREDKTPHMERYLPELDILVNAVTWQPGEPHLVTREMLRLMKKTALIVDISCDRNGAVESCIPTPWNNPTYRAGGVTHVCIDNLPAAIPKESSEHLSSMILPFVLKVAGGAELETGLMTKDGVFEFRAKAGKQRP